jgi:putative transposase
MPINRFEPGAIVEIDDVDYYPQAPMGGRHVFLNPLTGAFFTCPDAQGVVGMPTDDQFTQLLAEGRAKVKAPRSVDRVRLLNDVAQWAMDQAFELDPAAAKRLAQVTMLDDAGVPNGEKAISRHMEKHWTQELLDKHGPHSPPRTIRYWRRTRGRPGARRAGQMVSMRGRAPRASRSGDVPSEIEWKHALEHQRTAAKPRDTYAAYVAEMQAVNEGRHPVYARPDKPYRRVSKETMRRRCNALECSATVRSKKGEQAVEQDWSGGGRSLVADFAMHMVIIDHSRLDVFAVDDEFELVLGRAWLTVAICVKTRAIVAYLITFIDPCVWTVGEILRRMALPKRPPDEYARRYPILVNLRGKPTEIIVDNAVEFRSHTLEAAARSAGFNVRFCPIKRPRYRAVCERAIGTINRMICEMLPGRTLPIAEARRLSYDAEEHACILMHELEAVANHVVAEYNTSPHADLGERQPALVFEKDANRYGINNFADLDAFRIDTMAVQQDAQLTPSGIKAFGSLRYHDIRAVRELLDDLVPLEARRKRRDDATATVDFRYDPMDIRHIHVWNRKTRKYVRLTCSDERYSDGMPIWFHDQIRKAAKAEGAAFNTEEERCAARARRIQAIKDINPEDKIRARKAVADLYEVPRLRQITGNIVHLHAEHSEPVTLDNFLGNDRAAPTSLDHEILSIRPDVQKRERRSQLRERRDQRNAGSSTAPAAKAGDASTTSTPAARPRRSIKGQF